MWSCRRQSGWGGKTTSWGSRGCRINRGFSVDFKSFWVVLGGFLGGFEGFCIRNGGKMSENGRELMENGGLWGDDGI
jgi:hypothetical protein